MLLVEQVTVTSGASHSGTPDIAIDATAAPAEEADPAVLFKTPQEFVVSWVLLPLVKVFLCESLSDPTRTDNSNIVSPYVFKSEKTCAVSSNTPNAMCTAIVSALDERVPPIPPVENGFDLDSADSLESNIPAVTTEESNRILIQAALDLFSSSPEDEEEAVDSPLFEG